MVALPTRRNVHNLTPWPLSEEHFQLDMWGWYRTNKFLTFTDSNTFKVEWDPVVGRIGGIYGFIRDVESGQKFVMRMKIKNSYGTLEGLSIFVSGPVVVPSVISAVTDGLMFLEFEANASGNIGIYIGAGWIVGEDSTAIAGYEITDVAVQLLHSGMTTPADYHYMLDDLGEIWYHPNGNHDYGGDKTKVAFNRTGNITITGSNTFTESYGAANNSADENVIAMFGDSLTQGHLSWVSRINRERHDLAIYGKTIGGWALQNMIDRGIGTLQDAVNEGANWGGMKAGRVIIQRCVNDMWTGTIYQGIDQTGPGTVGRACVVAEWCMSMGLPVMFFTASPVNESIWLAIPEGLAAARYYNANVLSSAKAYVAARGHDDSNIFLHNNIYMEETTRPGSFVLESDYNAGDGIHYTQAGHDKVYEEFVTNGVLDTFMAHDFIYKDAVNEIYMRDFPKRIPFRKVS